MIKRRDAKDDGTTAAVESERRSIDEGWASLTNGSDRDADRADASALAEEELIARGELQAAYDAATRRAADWYTSRLGTGGDEIERGHDRRTRHASGPAVPAARNDRTRRTERVDR